MAYLPRELGARRLTQRNIISEYRERNHQKKLRLKSQDKSEKAKVRKGSFIHYFANT